MVLEVHWDTIIAIAIPAITAAFFISKHVWSSTKTIEILKYKVSLHDELAMNGKKEHDEIYDKISDIEIQITKLSTKMDVLLNGNSNT